tara:strand:+ start:7573 stop:8967 length:1395 start_codon:yes stop_codon:yes gene_type:complete
MANLTVTHAPNDWEMANGNVILSLYDTFQWGGQHAIRFFGTDGVTILNEIRQNPNIVGYTHFDLQKLITNQMSLPSNPEGNNPSTQLNLADGAIFDYKYEYGFYLFNNWLSPASQFPLPLKTAINGRKAYYDVDWTVSPYIPTISDAGVANSTDIFQPAVTDKNIYPTRLMSTYTTTPSWAVASLVIHPVKTMEASYETLSWLNGWNDGTPVPQATYNGINGFLFAPFDSAGASLGEFQIVNTTTTGGGPDVAFNDSIAPTGDFRMIGVKVGPTNNTTLDSLVDLDHYYVAPFAYSQDPDVSIVPLVIGDAYRYQIIPPECKDYDVIQMAWINSFGNFDYFDFQKKNVRTDAISRNNYNPTPESWSSTNVTISTYTRGKTTFSTEVVENQTATTRYISEDDSQYLKNLYRAPSAFCRFAGDTTWTPVILTSNAWTEKTVKNQNRRLFQHEISFNIAWNPQIQNG